MSWWKKRNSFTLNIKDIQSILLHLIVMDQLSNLWKPLKTIIIVSERCPRHRRWEGWVVVVFVMIMIPNWQNSFGWLGHRLHITIAIGLHTFSLLKCDEELINNLERRFCTISYQPHLWKINKKHDHLYTFWVCLTSKPRGLDEVKECKTTVVRTFSSHIGSIVWRNILTLQKNIIFLAMPVSMRMERN